MQTLDAIRGRKSIRAFLPTPVPQEAIAERGRFNLVLAGGRTPEATYLRLAGINSDWHRWHLFFSDERCLPADHPDRNSRMAARALTERVPIPATQLHPIPAELGAQKAALRYERVLQKILPFDLVLLGLGEDGHTASLFPGHRHPAERLVVPVHGAPKPPSERVSLSARALGSSRKVLFLVTGREKSQAVTKWREGASLPVAGIACKGELEVLLDQAAWPDSGQAPAKLQS